MVFYKLIITFWKNTQKYNVSFSFVLEVATLNENRTHVLFFLYVLLFDVKRRVHELSTC